MPAWFVSMALGGMTMKIKLQGVATCSSLLLAKGYDDSTQQDSNYG